MWFFTSRGLALGSGRAVMSLGYGTEPEHFGSLSGLSRLHVPGVMQAEERYSIIFQLSKSCDSITHLIPKEH